MLKNTVFRWLKLSYYFLNMSCIWVSSFMFLTPFISREQNYLIVTIGISASTSNTFWDASAFRLFFKLFTTTLNVYNAPSSNNLSRINHWLPKNSTSFNPFPKQSETFPFCTTSQYHWNESWFWLISFGSFELLASSVKPSFQGSCCREPPSMVTCNASSTILR